MKFTEKLKETRIVEGAVGTLTCKVNKQHKVTWFKDGKEMKPKSTTYEIIEENLEHTLKIPKATLEDEAEYTVRLPEDETKAMLWVEGDVKI